MMDMEAESIVICGRGKLCLAVPGPALAAASAPPPCAVAFFPVSAGDEGQPHFPCLPVLEPPSAPWLALEWTWVWEDHGTCGEVEGSCLSEWEVRAINVPQVGTLVHRGTMT